MSAELEYLGPDVPMPKPATMFGVVENKLRAQAAITRDRVVTSVRNEIPRVSGRTAQATTGRVANAPGGFKIKVTNRIYGHVLRFLQGGTGLYGPRRQQIPRARRGVISSGQLAGRRPSGKGQRPQNTIKKMMRAPWLEVMPQAIREMRRMWDEACDEVYGKGGRR